MKIEKMNITRRKLARNVAISGVSLAALSSILSRATDASMLFQNVPTDMSDGKSRYGKCLVKLPVRKMGETSMFSAGADSLHGFPCNIIYAFGLREGIVGLSKEPHVHDHDEVIYFIGSDPKDIGDLGATVNFKIGPKGQEEDHIFSEPTAVVIPRGVWHCPMIALKCSKPFLCMAVALTSKYEFRYAEGKQG